MNKTHLSKYEPNRIILYYLKLKEDKKSVLHLKLILLIVIKGPCETKNKNAGFKDWTLHMNHILQ